MSLVSMSFAEFDAPTQALMIAAYDDVWLTIGDTGTWSETQRVSTTSKITKQLLDAANAGERDPALLRRAALRNL
jgi:hypothetical protein